MSSGSRLVTSIFRHPVRVLLLFSIIVVLLVLPSKKLAYIQQYDNSIQSSNVTVEYLKASGSGIANVPSPARAVPQARQNHFVYVKIEKTGSSTFSNIFSSYGYRHGLNMMMSTNADSLVNTREMEPGGTWDIGPDRNNVHLMEQHARYNHKFYTKNFPNNTVYITSLRDPVKWFISFVDFMNVYRRYDPRKVLQKDKLFYKRRKFITGMQRQVHNNFLQWLGFDVYESGSLQALTDYIDFVDRRFKLVMFTEYFDESLVLLKRLMNWSLADIFYTYANEGRRKSGVVLTQQEEEKLLDSEHNLGDWLLYQHFNKTFWEKIAQQPSFYEEVKVFKLLNVKVQEFCFSDDLKQDKTLRLQLSTLWEERFEFGEKDCLSIRVRNGKALEFSEALDVYCPFRFSKSRKHSRLRG